MRSNSPTAEPSTAAPERSDWYFIIARGVVQRGLVDDEEHAQRDLQSYLKAAAAATTMTA